MAGSVLHLPTLFLTISIVTILLAPLRAHSDSDSVTEKEQNETVVESNFVNEAIPESLRYILTDEVAAFEEPLEMKRKFVYYISGFDEEKRPVWVIEVGNWNMRKYIEGGKESYNKFDNYILKGLYTMLNATRLVSTEEEPVTQGKLVVDMENFDLTQIRSAPTISYILNRFATFVSAFVKVNAIYIVNANFIAHSLVELVRPIMGREFDKVEIFGTSKAKWIPHLLRKIPQDQLPEWYGGLKDFKPYHVYG